MTGIHRGLLRRPTANNRCNVQVEIYAPVVDRMRASVSASSTEEGGKLVGRVSRVNGQCVITVQSYIDSGPAVQKSDCHLLPDGEHQERLFRLVEGYDSDIEHIGSWHSHHCNGLPQLSEGDVYGYIESVNSHHYHSDVFLVLLVTHVLGRDLGFRSYLFVRDNLEYWELRERDVRIVSAAYRLDGILREAEVATRAHLGRTRRTSGAREAEDLLTDLTDRLLMTIRAEDRAWLTATYEGVTARRNTETGAVTWRWTVPADGGPLRVTLTYPQRIADAASAHAALRISVGERVVSASAVGLGTARHREIADEIRRACTIVRGTLPGNRGVQ